MSLFVSGPVRRRLAEVGDPVRSSGKLPIESSRTARRVAAALELEQAGASALNALSLLEEAVRRLLAEHMRRRGGDLESRLRQHLQRTLGRRKLDRLLAAFGSEFALAPQPADTAAAAGAAESEDGAKSSGLLIELVVFLCLRGNPALGPIVGRLAESPFLRLPELDRAAKSLNALLAEEPGLEDGQKSLLAELVEPADTALDSPVELLRWLRARWQPLEADFDGEITAGLDLAAEESAPRFPPGPGPVEPPSYAEAGEERHYSEDRDWMRGLVLVAKNCLVWLSQLSGEHGREINDLAGIPDEALAGLAERGFNGLWLIGVWERSPASQRIKRLCGNTEAEASAYSLRGYRIAQRLGGEAALEALSRRAERHGIRLAADMVPNHTAIDSDWVIEHPDRFIWQANCPFPAYRFDGPDLSTDPRVKIQIEDRYFDRSDAAVVFRREDLASGEVRFLYHGNDGTSMPWNDTAQLDYLNAATREAVAEQILEVARRFPVIRFDAAMTLTRQHFQRLWHPRPGDAGAIPSRADHALAAEPFDQRMPSEFWREVVDRVAAEAPETLLLAEAFWLMEGYFVRTLGMHRVYNSAFMHMLRDGDNAGLRQLIAETLAFDPAVLERFVNFLSNPDEASTIDQFGSGPRYRGACVLLATMPGLPMFAHGQVEGLAERYGMEYARSYRDERPDSELVDWHERRIAPLLARRELFASGKRFQLLDFATDDGGVDPAVLAYANGTATERRLVVFHNRDASVRGRLRDAVPRAEFGGEGGRLAAPLVGRATLADALALDPTRSEQRFSDLLGGPPITAGYRDLAEVGLELELGPYDCRVLAPEPAGDGEAVEVGGSSAAAASALEEPRDDE